MADDNVNDVVKDNDSLPVQNNVPENADCPIQGHDSAPENAGVPKTAKPSNPEFPKQKFFYKLKSPPFTLKKFSCVASKYSTEEVSGESPEETSEWLSEEISEEASEESPEESPTESSQESSGMDGTSQHSLVSSSNKTVHDFKDIFRYEEDCDVIIKLEDQEFLTHGVVLKARSPVFACALRKDMKDKDSNIIDIVGCDALTFFDFLCYLYGENIEFLSTENVYRLFAVADKYNVQDLKSECFLFMKQNFSVDTFCDTIALAFQHSEKDLVTSACEFLAKNQQIIIKTEKWKSFASENPAESELLKGVPVFNRHTNQ